MTIVEKAVPLKTLGLSEGDTVIGYRMASGSIIFQVAQETDTPASAGPRVREWISRWRGSMKLEPGETRESLREAAMQEKFGA